MDTKRFDGTSNQWEADKVLIDKLIYNSQSPKRGDIIVFSPTDELKKQQYTDPFISRIVALPGEKVELKKNQLYINNKPLAENYLPSQEKTDISVCATDAEKKAEIRTFTRDSKLRSPRTIKIYLL